MTPKPEDEPLTQELLDELMTSSSVGDFLGEHTFLSRTLSDYLQQQLRDRDLVQPQVVRDAQLNPAFGYQVFTGKRGASFETVVRISLAMGLSSTETNRALRAAGQRELYPKQRRDAILIFCLEHRTGLMGANEALYKFGEELLC